jgi:hypothetical protein
MFGRNKQKLFLRCEDGANPQSFDVDSNPALLRETTPNGRLQITFSRVVF